MACMELSLTRHSLYILNSRLFYGDHVMKKAIKLISFFIITILVLARVYHILSWKDTYGNYVSSVQQLRSTPKNTIDVVFAGSSHCYAGINPDVLWDYYGISAFDMAISGQDRSSTYHYVKEVCKTQNPKVVFVDLYGATFDRHAVQGNVYRNMLSMPLSRNSIDLIYSYVEEDQMDYVLKWPIVHTRYRELENYDFYQYPYSTYGRGYMYNYDVWPVDHDYEMAMNTAVTEISDDNRQWINNLCELSQDEGFDIYFMTLPMETTEEEKMIFNGIYKYLDEENIPYIDFGDLESTIGLYYGSDFSDPTHLNTFGAEKLSRSIGSILEEKYDLEDHRGDSRYSLWDKSLLYGQHRYNSYLMQGRVDIDTFTSWLKGYDNCYVILATCSDYRSGQQDIAGALNNFGLTNADYENGGIWIFEDGELVKALSKEPDEYNRDLDSYTTLHIDTDKESQNPIIEINEENVLTTDYGLNIIVYDKILGNVVDIRSYQDQVEFGY